MKRIERIKIEDLINNLKSIDITDEDDINNCIRCIMLHACKDCDYRDTCTAEHLQADDYIIVDEDNDLLMLGE